ncbi:MAG TPA: TonB-dependent receptor [Opitutaceae bacterium]|nr:TonB-dependent receptor [Opitutaceae bacterium]
MNLTPQRFLPAQLATALLAASFFPAGLAASPAAPEPAAAAADSGGPTIRLDEMEVFTEKTSALTQAPTDARIDSLEPNSVISAQTINNQIAPTADYATIANIAPSVANIETEGPGLSEAKMTQMRGFTDGQYNVTYDGIPFGDANGETHHTTSYFPAKVLGGMVIDRGPGTASDIGENTFGGTIGLLSKDPRPDAATVLTVSDGSWNTFLGNIEVNTGNLPRLDNASIVGTYQYMSSDGYRSFSYLQRNTYFLKYLQPVGKNSTLTVVGNYNNIKFNNPGAVTQAQINQFGRNFGLDANPFDPNNDYYPYNYQQKQADFEYIGFKTSLGNDFSVEDKAYTDAYNNDSHEKSVDPVVGGTTKFPGTAALQKANGVNSYTNSSANTLPGTTSASNDDPGGQAKVNAYRNFGDYLAVVHGEDSPLKEQFGVWVEQVRANRYDYALDYSPAYLAANPQEAFKFGAFDPSTGVKANTIKPGYQWYMHVYNKTFQPYVDLTWKPTPNLTIEAGVKDSNFTIDLEAPLNQGTEQPDFTNNTYTNWEPHFSANYLLTPNWSVYAQLAKGIAYPIVTDEENVPSDAKDLKAGAQSYDPARLKEEQTINYQLGTVYKRDRFNGDADVYLIDINNLVSSVADPNDSTNSLFFLSKGAWVSGLEAEGTYYLGGGLSLFANGSLNRAVFKTNPGVPGFNVASLGTFGGGYVPNSTASAGLVFNQSGWFASVNDKYIGPGIVYSSALVNPDMGLFGQTDTGLPGGAPAPVRAEEQGGFSLVSLSGGYAWKLPAGSFVHSIKLKLQIDNALNRKVQVLNSVGSNASSDNFLVIPTTDYFVTLSTEF